MLIYSMEKIDIDVHEMMLTQIPLWNDLSLYSHDQKKLIYVIIPMQAHWHFEHNLIDNLLINENVYIKASR